MISDKNILLKELDSAITNVINGNKKSIEILYNELCKPVFHLAYAITRDYYLAEDVMQETFLRVKAKAHTYSAGTNPKAWILSITRNIALNSLNKTKKEDITDCINSGINGDDFASVDFKIDLQKALDCLDLNTKQIVTLHISANMRFTEISKILNINKNTVRTKYFRALKKLKEYFTN